MNIETIYSGNGRRYTIGVLACADGKTFKTYIRSDWMSATEYSIPEPFDKALARYNDACRSALHSCR